MCIATAALIILAVITVIFVMTWNTPVIKSSGREQMVRLLIGIGACCVVTYIVVAPPSTGVCVCSRELVYGYVSLLHLVLSWSRSFALLEFSTELSLQLKDLNLLIQYIKYCLQFLL